MRGSRGEGLRQQLRHRDPGPRRHAAVRPTTRRTAPRSTRTATRSGQWDRHAARGRPRAPEPPEVQDPVLGHSCLRVEAPLVLTIERQAGLGDLDDERGARGVLVAVVAPGAAGHRDVGSGSESSVSAMGPWDRISQPRPSTARSASSTKADRRVVRAALGLADHQLPAEQLDRLARLEDAGLDQACVLGSGRAAETGGVGLHAWRLARRRSGRQCRARVTTALRSTPTPHPDPSLRPLTL